MALVLLFNTSFKNKGDALMNQAIITELGNGHVWAVPANLHVASRRATRSYRLCLVSDLAGATWKQRAFNFGVSIASFFARAAGPALRRRLGVCTVEDIDVAIDVSGYCYGDVWGQRKIEWGERAYSRLRRAGARVILMPKTWGPFERISKSSVRSMLRFVDIAFARDEYSMRTLGEIAPAPYSNVRYAPDYTHRVNLPCEACVTPRNLAYVIPSYRVIDSGALSKIGYYQVLSEARRALLDRGLLPKLLIHEVANDLRFVGDAALLGFSEQDVILIDDPVEVKHAIAGAAAIVTSRLHGLYNALNSGVPVAVIAWVFKYRAALRQYGCEECLVDITNPTHSVRAVVEMITDGKYIAPLKAKMQAGKAESDRGTNEMWAEIRLVCSPLLDGTQ